MQGYEALREGAGWLDLSSRGKIAVRGEDRARLLHAMSTNHVQGLTPGEGVYAFFLNAQGRILADANILCRDGEFLLDTEPETAGALMAHLERYIIADDVTLANLTGSLAAIAVEGPAWESAARALGVSLADAPCSHVPFRGGLAARLSFTGGPGFWLIVPPEEGDSIRVTLEQAGAIRADEEAARTVRIERGRPRYGEDLSEANIPQETRQMRALHFNKGCYLGQEIVERVRSRGHVNRLLVRLEFDSATPPGRGAKLFAGEKEAGQVTSAAYSPAGGKALAFGYLRAEHARPGSRATAEGPEGTFLEGKVLPEPGGGA